MPKSLLLILLTFLILLILSPALAGAQDPTRPPTAAEIRGWLGESSQEAPDSDWRLQSILASDQRRLAIINGQRVRPGDRIQSAQVRAVEVDHVVLDQGGREIVLFLGHRRQPSSRQD